MTFNKKIDAKSGDRPPLNAENFFGDVIGELSGILEDVVGLSDAEGFIATVGDRVGLSISDRFEIGKHMTPQQIGDILVDLKARIGGDFRVAALTDRKIVLTNARCPFGARVIGKKSLCMMTTNVFGRVTSDRNGYAHISIDDSIAAGANHCQVTVTLEPEEGTQDHGHEFFRD